MRRCRALCLRLALLIFLSLPCFENGMAMPKVNAAEEHTDEWNASQYEMVDRILTDADLTPVTTVVPPTPESSASEPSSSASPADKSSPSAKPTPDPFSPDEKTEELGDRYDLPLGIIGEIEPVYIEDIPQAFSARIDTGASLCSVDAEEVKHFERDGKPWVSFRLVHRESGESHVYEKRVKRQAAIKLTGGDDAHRRPLVEMTVRIGGMTMQRDFTLNDRGNFQYQVLIGRNLLNGVAAVDVSRSLSLEQTEQPEQTEDDG